MSDTYTTSTVTLTTTDGTTGDSYTSSTITTSPDFGNDSFGGNATTEYYYGDDGYYEDDYYYLDIFPFEIIILGYVRPALILLTTLTNIFVVGYFMTRKNRGKASNLLFVSIAFSDTMTGLSLLPNSFLVYAKDFSGLSAILCRAYMILRLYVSRVFHTVSVWQTLLLGLQRYICVCHPFISTRVCTFWITFVCVVVMYGLAIILHIYHLLMSKLSDTNQCMWVAEEPCKETCVYMWFTIVLQHISPACLLTWLTFKTIMALKKAQRRASTIISNKTSVSAKRSSKERIITITATLIVICFLIPELPHGIYKLVFVVLKQRPDWDDFKVRDNHIFLCVYEILLIISFNANFWIYCAMMYDFRRALLNLLTLGTLKRGVTRLRSFSASSMRKDGSMRSAQSRSSSLTSRNRILSRTTSVHSTTSDNVHAVRLVVTPTSENGRPEFPRQTYDAQDDDVFV